MPVNIDTDIQITVFGTIVTAFDSRQRIIGGIQNQADVAMAIHGTIVVFADLNRFMDTNQSVVHPLGHNCETGQTVFAVLINESHAIQT